MSSVFSFIIAGLQRIISNLRGEYDGSSEIGRFYRNELFTRTRSDKEALQSDMKRVSGDMRKAWNKVVETYG